ncbi:MAG: hypothetical protein ACRC1F_00085 [Metamycoplasmataceae bacterium]
MEDNKNCKNNCGTDIEKSCNLKSKKQDSCANSCDSCKKKACQE